MNRRSLDIGLLLSLIQQPNCFSITINGMEHDIRNAVKGFDKKLVRDILNNQIKHLSKEELINLGKVHGVSAEMLNAGVKEYGLELWQAFESFLSWAAALTSLDGPLPFGDIVAIFVAGAGVIAGIWAVWKYATKPDSDVEEENDEIDENSDEDIESKDVDIDKLPDGWTRTNEKMEGYVSKMKMAQNEKDTILLQMVLMVIGMILLLMEHHWTLMAIQHIGVHLILIFIRKN